MRVKQCHKPSPKHHFYRLYGYHSQSWVVYGIVLPTLLRLAIDLSTDTTALKCLEVRKWWDGWSTSCCFYKLASGNLSHGYGQSPISRNKSSTFSYGLFPNYVNLCNRGYVCVSRIYAMQTVLIILNPMVPCSETLQER